MDNVDMFQPQGKKRRLQDHNTENINVAAVNNKSMSLQRSRLPQLSLRRIQMPAAVASTNPAGAVKKAGCSTVPPSSSRGRLTQSTPGKAKKTVAKRRPAWDVKGKLEDTQKLLSECAGKLQVAELQRKRLQESADVLGIGLSHAASRVKELEDKLRTAECQLQSRESELGQLRHDNTALQTVLPLREAQISSLTTEVKELSATLEDTKSTLVYTQQQLDQKAACADEQQKLIGSLEEQLQHMEQALTNTEQERRRLHNDVQELKGNIRVICRVRPLLDGERHNDMMHIQFLPSDEKVITLTKEQESHTGNNQKEVVKHNFSFDHVLQPVAKQEKVFEDISQLVQSALDGYNVCIFAYGQTGSGKTYTMEGPDELTCDAKGMIPRAVDQIFVTARRLETMGWMYKFTASFLEIYNETIRDLLVTKSQKAVVYEIKQRGNQSRPEQLYVTNLKYVTVGTVEEVNKLIATAKSNRSVAKTAINHKSSRSHSVFQLQIDGSNTAKGLTCRSTLCLVDLAGSERLDKSCSTGERLREAQAINTSLSWLGLVIQSLSNKEAHIPYRNSKLTLLLQNSLGGNSKTLMFVNVSPLEEDFHESLNTLRFASQVNECNIGTAQMNRKRVL
ncbi:carboxy-terminal kinesin 2-like isoform X2 [Amblyraja radiata]|uniref:carboxy-terminal kinesin 2-like isoform X2 n=1 Tax=Amblyraja radiata TaxID=386614 RepID=UPI0014041DAD|nr:carboxy-terminal kinesin 2-like isoform X2 [Amblyraja radiata]